MKEKDVNFCGKLPLNTVGVLGLSGRRVRKWRKSCTHPACGEDVEKMWITLASMAGVTAAGKTASA